MDSFDQAMRDMPLVAVLRGISPEEIDDVSDALVEAGFRFLEVPLNSPRPYESIARLVERCPPEVLTGAGTVLWPEQVGRLAALGATLVVTPSTDVPVIEASVREGLYPMIGCLTPSEALQAVRYGARALKVFPASRMGPNYLKDVRAVLPTGTRLIPVGGIDRDTMEGFHKTGADGFGFGTNLYVPGRSASEVGARARDLVAEYRRLAGG